MTQRDRAERRCDRDRAAIATAPELTSEWQIAIAVIGAGQMGNGIAHVFAQAGIRHDDRRRAEALARGRETIEKNLDRQVKKGTLDAADDAMPRWPHRRPHRRSTRVGERRPS